MVWRLLVFTAILICGVYFLSENIQSLAFRTALTELPTKELAETVAFTGSVQIKRGHDKWKSLTKADRGFKLLENDEIQTGDNSEVTLKSFGTVFTLKPLSLVKILPSSTKTAKFVFRQGSYKLASKKTKSKVSFVGHYLTTDYLEISENENLEEQHSPLPTSPPQMALNPLPTESLNNLDHIDPVTQIRTSLNSKHKLFKRCALNLFRQGQKPPESVGLQFMVKITGATDRIEVITKANSATSNFKKCIRSVVERVRVLDYEGPELTLRFPLNFSSE